MFVENAMACTAKNANEEKVLTLIGRDLKGKYAHCCTCMRCISDMAAIALNFLPPHYCVDSAGEKELGSPWIMVENAVAEAIERVIENPKHPYQAQL